MVKLPARVGGFPGGYFGPPSPGGGPRPGAHAAKGIWYLSRVPAATIAGIFGLDLWLVI